MSALSAEHGRPLNDTEIDILRAWAHDLDQAAAVIAAAERSLPNDSVRRRLGDARMQARFASASVNAALALAAREQP